MSVFYPQGRYQAEITQQAMTKASTGTPQLVLKFRVLQAVLPSGDTEMVTQQYERTCYRAITENTMKYVERDLEALGFNGSSLRELDPNNSTHETFVGSIVEMNCGHEKDQKGELREKWSVAWKDRPSEAIEGEPLNSAEYRQLDALFSRNKGGGTQQRQKSATKPKGADLPRQAAEPHAITDDDIPF